MRKNVMTTTVSDGSTLQDRVIVLTSAEDSAGEVFRFEYVARQVTPPLRDHVHTEQEERLEVLEGTVRCRVAGIDHLLQRGQGMIIPPGTPHAVWNDDPRGSRSIGEFRPAMNAERIFRPFIVDADSTR
jgi:quercetin dioxygenase-like cupin family protein